MKFKPARLALTLYLKHLMFRLNQICLFSLCIFLAYHGLTQTTTEDTSAYRIVVAGPEYGKPLSWQKLWGRNWRVDWKTPVNVPTLYLDKFDGGLTASRTNGGNETKGLRLKSANGKEYALRSINKSRSDVVPKEVKNTFVEDIIRDGVSMSQPYASFCFAHHGAACRSLSY